jgi:WD40 repeat protein
VYVWDVATQRVVAKLAGADGYTDATFSPQGDKLLINRLGDGFVREWPVTGGAQKPLFHVPAGEELNTVEFDRTGDRVVWSSNTRVVVRDLDTGDEVRLGGVRDEDMYDARISPDGTQVAAAGSLGVIKLWHRARPERPYAVLRGHRGAVNTIAWSPQGDRLVSVGADLTIRVWNVSDGRAVVLRGHSQETTSAVFTPSGSHVISASKDGTVRLWDARGDRASVVLESRDGPVLDAALAPDGRTIASTGDDGTVHVFQCEVCGASADALDVARSRAP